MKHYFKFKTKLMEVDDEGIEKKVLFYKKVVSRCDCTMRNHEHRLYNSDLFLILLNRCYQELIGNRRWEYVDSLPDHIRVEGCGLLKSVIIEIPDSFK